MQGGAEAEAAVENDGVQNDGLLRGEYFGGWSTWAPAFCELGQIPLAGNKEPRSDRPCSRLVTSPSTQPIRYPIGRSWKSLCLHDSSKKFLGDSEAIIDMVTPGVPLLCGKGFGS